MNGSLPTARNMGIRHSQRSFVRKYLLEHSVFSIQDDSEYGFTILFFVEISTLVEVYAQYRGTNAGALSKCQSQIKMRGTHPDGT